MSFEDDLRTRLRDTASEATFSDDAWDRITEATSGSRQFGRRPRLAIAVAVIAVTGLAVALLGARGHETESTTGRPSAGSRRLALMCGEADAPAEVAGSYLRGRGLQVGAPYSVLLNDPDHARVIYTGAVKTEVRLHRNGSAGGWCVGFATSAVADLEEVALDGRRVRGLIAVHDSGDLQVISAHAGPEEEDDTDEQTTTQPTIAVKAGRTIHVDAAVGADAFARIAARLTTSDGAIAFSERWASTHRWRQDNHFTGVVRSAWPTADAGELARLRRQRDSGHRPDLASPTSVAQRFLSATCDGCAQMVAGKDFAATGTNSGAVPYTINGAAAGRVTLRRSDPAGIWYVSRVTSGAKIRVRVSGHRATVTVHADLFELIKVSIAGTGTTTYVEGWASPRNAGSVTIDVPDGATAAVVTVGLGDGGANLSAVAVVPL